MNRTRRERRKGGSYIYFLPQLSGPLCRAELGPEAHARRALGLREERGRPMGGAVWGAQGIREEWRGSAHPQATDKFSSI